jgi:hypothetical protein
VKGRLLLDVVVGEGSAILKLLSSEDETLLVRGDALLVLDLRLHIVDGVGRLDLEGDGLAGEGLDEDLHDGDWGAVRCLGLEYSKIEQRRCAVNGYSLGKRWKREVWESMEREKKKRGRSWADDGQEEVLM